MGKRTYAMAVAINSKMMGAMIAPSPKMMIAPMIIQNRTVRAIKERPNQTQVEGELPGDVVDCSGSVFVPVPRLLSYPVIYLQALKQARHTGAEESGDEDV